MGQTAGSEQSGTVPVRIKVVWLVPVAGAVVYGAVLLANLHRLIRDLYWNSDTAAPVVIATRLIRMDGRSRTYVTQPIYVGMNVLTQHLPGHRRVWLLIPVTMAVLSIAVFGWTVRRIGGLWAAVMAVVLTTAVAPTVLATYLTQTHHGTTWLATVLLAAFGVAVFRHRDPATGLLLALGTALSVVAGVAAASDALLIVCGVLPLIAVGLLFLRVPDRRKVAGVVALTGILTLTFSFGFRHLFTMAGLVIPAAKPGPLRFASYEDVQHNMRLLVEGFLLVTNGSFLGARVTIHALLAVATAVIAIMAFVVLVHTSLVGVRRVQSAEGAAVERFAFVAFWTTSAGLVVAAFVFSQFSADIGSARYLVPVVFAIAGVGALAVGEHRRTLLAVLVSVVVVAAIVSLVSVVTERRFRVPRSSGLPGLVRVLQANRLRRGYGDYWYANAISWSTGNAIEVLAVRQGHAEGSMALLCPQLVNTTTAAFRTTNEPTFVITDPLGGVDMPPPESRYGAPAKILRQGRFTVYIYSSDVAAGFCPAKWRRL